ncbi:MAG: hypothetical protein JWO36_6622 [Myxococcales bacterium]|nr:hypothetical protein [Myxococcales bacterium]
MPFTPAHPLAVWPLMRWHRALRLDPICLVIGSMAPDFEYFIHGEQRGNFGHTLLGIPLWGVPVTLILSTVFHAVVKWPLLFVAPRWIAQRAIASVAKPWPGSWTIASLAGLVLSSAIGDMTHLVWDGFTHNDGFGERHFPVLGEIVRVPALGDMVVARVLQYGFSVIGLVAVTLWAWQALRTRPPREIAIAPRLWSRLVFVSWLVAGVAVVMFRVFRVIHATDPGSIVVSAISGLLAGTLCACIVLHTAGLRLRDSAAADPS